MQEARRNSFIVKLYNLGLPVWAVSSSEYLSGKSFNITCSVSLRIGLTLSGPIIGLAASWVRHLLFKTVLLSVLLGPYTYHFWGENSSTQLRIIISSMGCLLFFFSSEQKHSCLVGKWCCIFQKTNASQRWRCSICVSPPTQSCLGIKANYRIASWYF